MDLVYHVIAPALAFALGWALHRPKPVAPPVVAPVAAQAEAPAVRSVRAAGAIGPGRKRLRELLAAREALRKVQQERR